VITKYIFFCVIFLLFRVNVDQDEDIETENLEDANGEIHEDISYERSWLVRKWHEFDVRYGCFVIL